MPIDHANDVPNGATVLVEALAMGKPIIITEADTNYIDVEKEGVGLTVKRHDVDGWINAINFLVDNPQKVKSMGENAYLLAKSKYNDQSFANNILMQMKHVNN
ncbi:glycosyltransferase [Bacteroides xylanisolvens]|uniref:Glycosyltransferase n=1 Tax=Bacteroides xylanisolvens TaxID=371601 RepID=A0A415KWK4_9BACE|nr:glycosyltransferase [Bacteroides xylanisolvens]RHL40631.1 glycosyltransferase [Bacteroides xylanisolvens]